jgi:hypothetical protein
MPVYTPPVQRVYRGILTGSLFVPNRWGSAIVQAETWSEANGLPMTEKKKKILAETNKFRRKKPDGQV